MSKSEQFWKLSTSCLSPKAGDWWVDIVKKYSEEGRYYHNINHLDEKFEHLDFIKTSLKDLNAVILAIFFQYFYYDPKAVDCEEKNIEFFKKFARDCGIPEESTLHSTVLALLQAASTSSTEEHKTPGVFGTDDLHYFLDLDMAILGSSQEHYVEYTSIVRREYAFLSDNMYRSLRLKVLQNFLQIPNIFATKIFREKFESQAKANIKKEVDSLKP